MSWGEALIFGFLIVIGGALARRIFNSWRPFAPHVEGKVPEPRPPQAQIAGHWGDEDEDPYP